MRSLLVVGDDPAIRDSLEAFLAGSYRVLTARDGEEGLRALERERVDLIVLDLLLPLVDGVETLREIRRRGWEVPVLAMSAHADRLEEAARLGADDALRKPFEASALEAKVERLLEGSSWSSSSPTPLGPAPI